MIPLHLEPVMAMPPVLSVCNNDVTGDVVSDNLSRTMVANVNITSVNLSCTVNMTSDVGSANSSCTVDETGDVGSASPSRTVILLHTSVESKDVHPALYTCN